MNAAGEIDALLKQHRGTLERKNKHEVWRFPDGKIWVRASTPSDHRAELNSLADLRLVLGVKRETHKNPDRKEKKGVKHNLSFEPVPPPPDWKAALRIFTTFNPEPCCLAVDVRVVPMTPVWCILRNLIGYGGDR